MLPTLIMSDPDSYTLRQVVSIIRGRMELLNRDPKLDGLERLGAYRKFRQLADDLEVTADHISKNR